MGESVEQRKFEVFVSDFSTSVEEWRRAMNAPSSELPELNAEQKEVVRRFGITEEEYKRGHLAGIYGQRRMRLRAVELGRAVQEILDGLGAGYQLKAVIAEMMKERWVARIQAPQKIVNVAIERELGDDIVDSNTIQDQDRLMELLRSSLERSERMGKK